MRLALKIGRRGGATSEPAAAADALLPHGIRRTTARAEAARANPNWTELDPVDLVKRGRFLVAASDDAVYSPYAGLVWHRDGDRIEYSYQSPLYFTVSAEGHVRLLEKYARTWSQVIAVQAGAR